MTAAEGGPQHYFTASPDVPSRPGSVVFDVDGTAIRLDTDRGVFSPGRIDPGTAFLIDRAPLPPAEGRLLDLGCGYGPLTVALALSSPEAEVVAVDVNQRARDLTRANAAALGLDNVTVAEPGSVEGSFDLVWSNPPIRVGKAALHELLLHWLGRLAVAGSAVLVVSRHLGADSLQRWLTDAGHPTVRLGSRKGYRLLRVGSDPGGVDGET